MKKLIYYPYFDIENENWLKFALLYIGKLKPIVPYSGDGNISEQTRKLLNETDLIEFHRPSFEEAHQASLDAFGIFEAILRHPERYDYTFNSRNIVRQFRNRDLHNSNLYDEKMTYSFKDFCVEEGFASQTSSGIRMNEKLINMYMSIIANIISEANGIPSVTDIEDMDRYNILLRHKKTAVYSDSGIHNHNQNRYNRKLSVAKANINLTLPSNIEEIPIELIIKMRNKAGFIELMESFHNELDRYISALEENRYDTNFVDQLSRPMAEIRGELSQLCPNLFGFVLGFWYVFNGNSTYQDVMGSTLLGWASYSSAVKINQVYSNSKDARFTRKYLATLAKVPY